MRFGRITPSSEILGSPLLRQLHAHARLLARLDIVVGERLAHLKNVCRVAAYREGVLTLSTSNNTLAGQIRYTQASLINTLRLTTEFTDLKKIRVSHGEITLQALPHRQALPPLPHAVGVMLRETADLVDDAELSEAFRRLASHASDNPTE